MSGHGVRFERDGALGRLVLDRPPLNVLDVAALEQLVALLPAVARDPAIKVLALTGAGKAFCAGLDVADHSSERAPGMLEVFHDAVRRLRAMPMPVVAVVHGAALGGGCELAIACDIVLARADAALGQPEIRLGALAPVAAALLPRMLGRQRTLDLLLTGRHITGAEAQTFGMVTHAWPADDFAANADAYLRNLLALSGPVLRMTKHAVAAWLDIPFEAALQNAESLYVDELLHLGDAHEGILAFLQKRPPVWSDA